MNRRRLLTSVLAAVMAPFVRASRAASASNDVALAIDFMGRTIEVPDGHILITSGGRHWVGPDEPAARAVAREFLCALNTEGRTFPLPPGAAIPPPSFIDNGCAPASASAAIDGDVVGDIKVIRQSSFRGDVHCTKEDDCAGSFSRNEISVSAHDVRGR